MSHKDLYNLDLLVELMVLLRQILFNLAIAVIAEAILIRLSAERVPFCTELLLGT